MCLIIIIIKIIFDDMCLSEHIDMLQCYQLYIFHRLLQNNNKLLLLNIAGNHITIILLLLMLLLLSVMII